MTSGELRSRVAFDRRGVAVDDGYGNTQQDFAEQFVVWARIQPRLGGEEVMAARLSGRQPVTIRIRQSTATRQITTDWRVRDARKGTVFNVRSIVDPEEHTSRHGAWLDLLAESGVATG